MNVVVEKIDNLPDGWAEKKLGDIGEYINGRGFKKSEWSDTGLPIIRIQDLTGTGKERNYYNGEIEDRHVVEPGDLLISWSATLGAYIWKGPTAALNQHIFKVETKINKKLHYYLIQHILDDLYRQTHGSGMVHITKTKFENTPVLIPKTEEQQKRIVAKIEELFSHIDAGIEALKKAKQLLKQYRQSVLKAAVTGELTKEWREANKDKLEPASQLLERILKERRQKWEEQQLEQFKAKGKLPKRDKWKDKYIEPKVFENGGYEIPDTWVMARAEQVCEFITKGTTPKKEKLSAGNGEVPFIKVYNLTFDTRLNFEIEPTFTDMETHEGFLARSKVYPGDVLMNIVGPPLGKVSIVSNLYDEWNINQAIAVYRPISGLSCRLLAYFLLSKPVVGWMLSKTKTTAGQVNLTLEISRDAPLPIMPGAEQLEMVRLIEGKLTASDRALTELEVQLVKAEKNKQAVLYSAFSGRLNSEGVSQ